MQENIRHIAKRFLLGYKGGMFSLRGSSMYPVFKEGWEVRLIPLDYGKVSCGDVIAFFCRETIIVHRVIGKFQRKRRRFFLEKGDNLLLPRVVHADSLIGKVIEVFDDRGRRINDRHWQQHSGILAGYSKVICFFYIILDSIKVIIVGRRKNGFTHFVYKLYWKLCLFPFRLRKMSAY